MQLEEKARSIDLGRKLFEKDARRFNLNPKTLVETETFRKFAERCGAGKADEVMAAIGYGRLAPRTVLAKLVPADQLQEKAPDNRVVSVVKRVLGPGEDRIKVNGVDDLLVLPRAVLQSDSRREDRRLHQPRQGCRRPLGELSQRRQPAVTTPSGESASSGRRATSRPRATPFG